MARLDVSLGQTVERTECGGDAVRAVVRPAGLDRIEMRAGEDRLGGLRRAVATREQIADAILREGVAARARPGGETLACRAFGRRRQRPIDSGRVPAERRELA